MADYTGRTLGAYELRRLLGRGAMGAVYLADQTALGREVAVKVLEKSELEDASAVTRFQGEARAVAALNHPNVMGVHDVGETEDCHYMAMELVDGESMGDAIKRGRIFTAQEIMDYGAQAARGLAAAHDAGLIHRDIKPDNILITASGVAKVADFGLARQQESDIHLTQTGAVYGSPAYMSPEQCQGEKLTPASDIYSLGVTLYFALAGAAPFDATSAVGVMMKHVTAELTFSDELVTRSPPDFLRIIERCMAKAPGDRWPTATQLAEALERVGRGEPLPSDLTLTTSRLSDQIIVGGRPAWFWPVLGVGGLSVLSLLIAVILFARSNGTGEPPDGGDAVAKPPLPGGLPDGDGSGSATAGRDPTSSGATTPDADLGKLVVQALGAERRSDLKLARELLEEAAAAGDLAAYSADAAELLERLVAWESALAESRGAVASSDLERALASAGEAHSLFPTPETLGLRTELGILSTEMDTVADLVGRGELEDARALLAAGTAGEYASLYEPAVSRLEAYEAALATVEHAIRAGAWDPAEEGLSLAASLWKNPDVDRRIDALARHREALGRGETAMSRGDLHAAESAYQEALAAMDTPRAREALLDVRFGLALAVADAAHTPAEELAALERASEIRHDEQLATRIAEVHSRMDAADEEAVVAAMEAAEGQMTAGNHAAAIATLEDVAERLPNAREAVRGQHSSMLARARTAARAAPAQRQSVPEANRLFAEAEKLRKTPLTLFSDKNEQSALVKYERIITTYPNSDRLADAYYGAAHMAENLEQIYKAVDYWEKAAKGGYRDPVECYLLAADCAEDDLDDRHLARRLLQAALAICKDGRRSRIQGKIQGL